VSGKKRPENALPSQGDPLWYKDAIIYELPVRAFADSNEDGIGDFRGLVRKLDYLQDLGVTALWLLPFYPSPLRDDGYDIADYTSINPIYGTLADFKVFLREAHRRHLRVITELVLNHSSDRHPWFQRARQAPPGSPERDFYVWSDSTEKYKEARIIFKDFEPSNWSWDPVARAYFWHRFYHHQPDLNFDNPVVHKAIFEILDFWLGLGIDGFRLDAVPYLYEREGTNGENLPETHVFLKELRRHVDAKFARRMLLAEANQWPEDAVAYFGQGDECHLAFHFPVMPRLFMAIRMEDRFPILDILQQTPAIPETCQWALFLRNHDELTLEMVTDEDRDYMYRMYAQDPQARINLGIRRRLAPLLENHRGKIELMNGLLLSLPGTPVLYYGDEIGMGDNIYLGDRNGVRTPMQWSGERNAGFSRANPQRLYLPAIIDPEYHFETINVEAQQNNSHSLLWWMKRLIALRKRFRAFSRGTLEFLYPRNHKVLAFVRRYQDECILVVANLSRSVQYVELDLAAFKGQVPVEMLGRTKFPAVAEALYFLTLGSYAFYWFTLELPRRGLPADEDQPPLVEVAGPWEEVFAGPARAALEEALPAYLRRCPWFCGRDRQTEAAMILETIALPSGPSVAHLALVQVEYSEGDSETYLLPLAFAEGSQAELVHERWPGAIVGRLGVRVGAERREGVLYDPLGEKEFARALLDAIGRHRRFKRANGELLGVPLPVYQRLRDGDPLPDPALLRGDRADSTVVFGDRFLLKLVRRVEEGTNPEVAIERFLAEKTAFARMPQVAGALEYRRSWGEAMTLAILQGFVANEGDAWRFTLDALGPYFGRLLTGRLSLEELPAPPNIGHVLIESVEVPKAVQELIGSYLETARLLGRRTAELHVALASTPDDPAFAPEPFTALYQRSLYQSLRSQALPTWELLRKRHGELPAAARPDADRLLGLQAVMLQRVHAILERKITAQRTRCHGNYHLGQVLNTGKDFVIIDFDGEGHRPLSDRLRKRSPLRDVASMVRSFHYASLLALQRGDIRAEDGPTLEPWTRFWHGWVTVAFLAGYAEEAGVAAFLPPTPEERQVLLDHYILKRGITELRAELQNVSERVWVPLRGLVKLLEG
jgi:maltose alpha-D-glucosyltransferase/alpha-amylase